MSNLLELPPFFWLSLLLVTGFTAHAWSQRAKGWGIPAMAVYGTVLAWYHGDALYNDYAEYLQRFPIDVLDAAWLQVGAFAIYLAIITPWVHRIVNPASFGSRSVVVPLIAGRDTLVRLQRPLAPALWAAASIWLVLSVIALMRTDFDVLGLFAPYLGRLAYPWGRARLGVSWDFLLAAVGYVSLFCLAIFGVVAALTRSAGLRLYSLALILLSWPAVFFDRTRNTMLAVALPGLLSLVAIRLSRRPLLQLSVLAGAFLVLSSWFAFVLAQRSERSISAAFAARDTLETSPTKHLGLNMFEELSFINRFLSEGTYRPNWGQRYFAEAVNVVPRSIWAGKPTIGLDYALARGQGRDKDGSAETVYATISTGMIGQGVVNFGPWGGPPAAALLVSVWVAMLARFDLTGNRIGRIPLYVLGLVLTFNLGRDITLLVAYPLFFGYLIIRIAELLRANASRRRGGAVA